MSKKPKKKSGEMPRVTVRLPERIITRLQSLATADHRTESDYHRKILIEHVAGQDAKKTA